MKQKKVIYSIVVFLIQLMALEVYSQEFSFPLYFKDAAGNRDTLILGYDPNATDSIDPEFGEINIVDQPWKNQLDVRAGEVKFYGGWENVAPLYESKIQIIEKTCNFEQKINIVAYCDQFPLVIKWDTSLFKNNSCVTGSLLNAWQYFSWDIVYGKTAFLSPGFWAFESDSLIIDSIAEGITPSVYTDGEKTIIMLWLAFADTATLPPLGVAEVVDKEDFIVYPNPVGDVLHVFSERKVERIELINNRGMIVLSKRIQDVGNSRVSLNLSNISSGIYLVRVYFDNFVGNGKIIKL